MREYDYQESCKAGTGKPDQRRVRHKFRKGAGQDHGGGFRSVPGAGRIRFAGSGGVSPRVPHASAQGYRDGHVPVQGHDHTRGPHRQQGSNARRGGPVADRRIRGLPFGDAAGLREDAGCAAVAEHPRQIQAYRRTLLSRREEGGREGV